MEVKIEKRYPVEVDPVRAWAVLSDVLRVATCMPGAEITEKIDDTHYKGKVKAKVGPAVMSFEEPLSPAVDRHALGVSDACAVIDLTATGTREQPSAPWRLHGLFFLSR